MVEYTSLGEIEQYRCVDKGKNIVQSLVFMRYLANISVQKSEVFVVVSNYTLKLV